MNWSDHLHIDYGVGFYRTGYKAATGHWLNAARYKAKKNRKGEIFFPRRIRGRFLDLMLGKS